MRKAHVLAGNKSVESTQYRIYMDSESRVIDGEHFPYLIEACFIDARYKKENWREYEKDKLSQFWLDASSYGGKKKAVTIYAHNMGYDLLVTGGIPTLVKAGFHVVSFFEKGATFILVLRKTEKYIVKKGKEKGKEKTRVIKTLSLVSTTNYFSVPLAKLGEVFNLKKLDFSYNEGSIEDAKIYCKRDVEIIKVAMETFIKFIKDENLGNLAKTTPGQAFNAFRHRFLDKEIFLHDSKESAELEREAYYGGRVECFQVGEFKGEFFGLDINSMYPYVMLTYQYPTRLISYRTRNRLSEIEKFLSRGLGICGRFVVKTNEPVLPLRLQGNLIFPVGVFETALSTPEIKMAIGRDLLLDVKEISVFSMADIFSSYVSYFYTKRLEAKKEGNKVYDLLFKLFLNSLYGKFGQKSDTWKRIGDADPEIVKVEEVYNVEEKKLKTYKIFGGSVFLAEDETEAFNSFCAIASHVTAYARQELLKFIEIAGWNNLYYSDTDSLFVNEQGLKNLQPVLSETELGKLKLEKKGNFLKIYAPKDYDFDGQITMKGIKKGGRRLSAPGEKKPVFEQEFWPKLNTAIRTGELDKYKTQTRKKILSREYNKGWVTDTGKVKPLEIAYPYEVNQLLPFDYHKYTLADYGQEENLKKKYRKVFAFDEEEIFEKQQQILVSQEKKTFRKTIIALGGVNDKDYEYIPRWAKRKKGRTLDELVDECQAAGIPVSSADELYNFLQIY